MATAFTTSTATQNGIESHGVASTVAAVGTDGTETSGTDGTVHAHVDVEAVAVAEAVAPFYRREFLWRQPGI